MAYFSLLVQHFIGIHIFLLNGFLGRFNLSVVMSACHLFSLCCCQLYHQLLFLVIAKTSHDLDRICIDWYPPSKQKNVSFNWHYYLNLARDSLSPVCVISSICLYLSFFYLLVFFLIGG